MKYQIKYNLIGGNLSNYDVLLSEIIRLSEVMNSEYGDQWVFTGSGALKILYMTYLNEHKNEEIFDFPVNDLDILVFMDKSKTINSNTFTLFNNINYNSKLEQRIPMRSKTFENFDQINLKSFDVTFTNLPISKILINNIPLIHPNTLKNFYSDLSTNSIKVIVINRINQYISQKFEEILIKKQQNEYDYNSYDVPKINFDDDSDDDDSDVMPIVGKLNFDDM